MFDSVMLIYRHWAILAYNEKLSDIIAFIWRNVNTQIDGWTDRMKTFKLGLNLLNKYTTKQKVPNRFSWNKLDFKFISSLYMQMSFIW